MASVRPMEHKIDEEEWRHQLIKILKTASGHSLIDLPEPFSVDLGTPSLLFDFLKTLKKNTENATGPGLPYALAFTKIDFDKDSLSHITQKLKENLDNFIINIARQAEIETTDNILSFLQHIAAPAGLIDEEKIPAAHSDKRQILQAIATIRTSAAEIIDLHDSYLDLEEALEDEQKLNPVAVMIHERLEQIDLTDEAMLSNIAIELADITTQLKEKPADIIFSILLGTLSAHHKLFKRSHLLWHPQETHIFDQIKSLDDLDDLPWKKLEKTRQLIAPVIKKQLLDDDHIKALKPSSLKVLAAIHFALTHYASVTEFEQSILSHLYVDEPLNIRVNSDSLPSKALAKFTAWKNR